MKQLIIFLLGALILCPPFSYGSEINPIKTYPVKGLFLSNGTKSNEFRTLYDNKVNKDMFIGKFIQEYKSNFANSIDEINDLNKYKTLVSYISIPRVSKYIDKRPNGDIIYLPLTLSLSFVNIISGETIYSNSKTIYGSTLTDDYQTISNIYKENYNKAIDNLITESKANFHPFEIPVKVIDNYKNLYILDKGSESGIAEDDELFDENSNQLSIIYSTVGYSIGKNEFGYNIAPNTTFIKQANNGGINQIKKPKVLLINDVANESIYDLLSSSLGEDSKINLLTINPTFNTMRSTVLKLNNLTSVENEQLQRNLPDYFLYFTFTKPIKASITLNRTGLKNEYFNMMACGTIFDKSGEIVFSQCADETSDGRASNKQYGASDQDRIEILSKNLIGKLSEKINEQINFKEFEFKIKDINNNEIILEDKTENLREGNSITLYKKIKANNNEYLIPMYKYNVIEVSNGLAKCQFDFPYLDNADKPSKSNIAKSTIIVSPNGSNFYQVSTDNMAMDGNEIELTNLDKFTLPILGAGLKKPLALDNSIITNKVAMINNSAMFKTNLKISENNSDLIIKPIYKINLKKHKVEGYTQINTYKILAGVETYKNNKKITQKTLTQEVTITLPLKNYQELLMYELQKAIYPLLQLSVSAIK